jgi:hypothetical protein
LPGNCILANPNATSEDEIVTNITLKNAILSVFNKNRLKLFAVHASPNILKFIGQGNNLGGKRTISASGFIAVISIQYSGNKSINESIITTKYLISNLLKL